MKEYLRRVLLAGSLLFAGCGESTAAAVPASVATPDNCPEPVPLGVFQVKATAEDCFPGSVRLTHDAVSPFLRFEAEQNLRGALRFVSSICVVTGTTPISTSRQNLFYLIASVQDRNCLARLASPR